MSAPNQHHKEADLIKFGLLATRTVGAINKLLAGDSLSPEENDILGRASEFLLDIANGAELVSKGHYQGHNSVTSMRALDYALGPLERLRDFVADKEIADVFQQMSDVLRQVISVKLENKDGELIKQIAKFFEALNDSLLDAVDRHSPPVGSTKTDRLATV